MSAKNVSYQPRVVDEELTRKLRAVSAVVIEGVKACGKTETARRQAASEVLLDVDLSARRAAEVDPELVLEGPTPRLLDEWQTVPAIWNHVRRASDTRSGPGQFILTGSAIPADEAMRHAGAGRISRIRMRPMSLFESGDSTGEVSLGAILSGGVVRAADPDKRLSDLIELVCRGGWPGMLGADLGQAMQFVRSYLDEIRRTDIDRVEGRRRDPDRVLWLMRSLARNVASEVSARTLAADAGGSEGSLHDDTVRAYLHALERLFVVEDQPAWSPRLRSRSRLRRSAKRHFVDPSLAAGALRAGPDRLEKDLNLFGLLFESLVVRDLRVYGQASDAQVYHYRDNTGLEVDAVVETVEGRWVAAEIKLGGEGAVDAGAESLLKFRRRVDTETVGEPSKLVVITGTGYGHERPDGVAVAPVTALGP